MEGCEGADAEGFCTGLFEATYDLDSLVLRAARSSEKDIFSGFYLVCGPQYGGEPSPYQIRNRDVILRLKSWKALFCRGFDIRNSSLETIKPSVVWQNVLIQARKP